MNEFIAKHFVSSINTELYKEPYYEKFVKIANDIARIYKNNPQNYFLPFTYMQHYYHPFTYTQNFKHIRQELNKDWLRCGHDNAGVDCSQIISKVIRMNVR